MDDMRYGGPEVQNRNGNKNRNILDKKKKLFSQLQLYAFRHVDMEEEKGFN